MASYQFRSFCCARGFTLLLLSLLAIIFLVSFAGMLVYKFEMSNEAEANWGRIGVFSSFLRRSVVFSRLCVLGSEAASFIFWVNNRASLYAGAPLQLTTGRMGCSGLCSLISTLMDGAVGFRFRYFHLVSEGMSVLLLLTIFLTWDWKDFVGSFVEVWKCLACINSSILFSYYNVGRTKKCIGITKGRPDFCLTPPQKQYT